LYRIIAFANGDVLLPITSKHLDLLKLAAGCPAQLRAGAAEVMGRNSGHTSSRRVLL
jgi:hypothetical protein